MIIHHQDGSKAIIETLVKAVRTKKNKIVLCYLSPQTKAKGIVEFTGEEALKFLAAMKSEEAIDDKILYSSWANISPDVET